MLVRFDMPTLLVCRRGDKVCSEHTLTIVTRRVDRFCNDDHPKNLSVTFLLFGIGSTESLRKLAAGVWVDYLP